MMIPHLWFPPLLFVLGILAGNPAALEAQDTLRLETTWRYQSKDLPQNGARTLDERNWLAVDAGSPLPGHLRPHTPQTVWYRTRIFLPDNWRKLAAAQGGLLLCLGYLEGADELWINGTRIAATGTLPPNLSYPVGALRTYQVPEHLWQWGLDNTLALRVGSPAGGRGLYRGPCYLRPLQLADRLSSTVVLNKPHGIYSQGDTAIHLLTLKGPDKETRLLLTAEFSSLPVTHEKPQTRQVTLPAGQDLQLRFTYVVDTPAVCKVRYLLKGAKEASIYADSIQWVVAPQSLSAAGNLPADFTGFWQRGRQLPGEKPPQARLIPDSAASGQLSKVFRIYIPNPPGAELTGWLSVPHKEGKFPAELWFAGYDEPADLRAGGQQRIILCLNVAGHGLARLPTDPVPELWAAYGLPHPEQMPIYGAYLQAARAVRWLATHPKAAQITVCGQGFGGTLAIAAAALEPEKVKACVAVDPWFGENYMHLRSGWFPLQAVRQQVENQQLFSWEDAIAAYAHFDLHHFAPSLSCPFLLVAPTQGNTWPLSAQVLLAAQSPRTELFLFTPDYQPYPLPESVQYTIRHWIAGQVRK
ncbi:MAG: alpha/beta fold hydrolase [Bacteroidetes bacterium]|nr:alpha/beta fold hydrolase [Bacteroidota bacterium]